MIRTVFFFANGNVVACDEHGQQVPEWQCGRWFEPLLDKMLAAGVVNAETELLFQGLVPRTTVGDILERRRRLAMEEVFDGK